MELIPGVNPIRLLRQGGGISQAAPGARSRRNRGVRARSAIRHTARYQGASASSTPDSGPKDPAREQRAEHTTRRSDGAAHYAPPTTATRCRRCLPARQACRAGLTLPAAGSDPKPASPRHLPTVPAVYRSCSATPGPVAHLDLQSGATTPLRALRCADRPCLAGSTAHADRWHRNGGGDWYPAAARSALSDRSRKQPTSARTWIRLIVAMPGSRCGRCTPGG